MDIKDKIQYRLFFIIGRGRSGTTLLNFILNQHPDIFIPQESPFIMNLYSKYKGVKNWDQSKREAFFNDLWKEIRLTQYWKLQNRANELRSDIMALDNEEASFQNFCKLVFYHQAVNREKPHVQVIGDKNPSYTLYIDELSRLFPNARFLFMVRDPHDNILSYKRVTYDFLNDTSFLAERWVLFNKRMINFYYKNPTKSFLLTHENLIQHAEQELQAISDFLGVAYTPDFLRFYESADHLESWYYFDKQPLDPKRVNKWKTKMGVEDKKITESICREIATKMDYEMETNGELSIGQNIKIAPKRILGWLAYKLEDLILYFPLDLKVLIINTYRKLTKTYPDNTSG